MAEIPWTFFIDEAYEADGVWVTIPRQESGREMWLEKLSGPRPVPSGVLGTPTVFEPVDLRIDFQVWEKLDDENKRIMQKFSPPMVLRVAITDEARQLADQTGRLRLAFWDGNEWVLFTKRKHLFRLTPKHGIAVIRDWGDPMVAWG